MFVIQVFLIAEKISQNIIFYVKITNGLKHFLLSAHHIDFGVDHISAADDTRIQFHLQCA